MSGCLTHVSLQLLWTREHMPKLYLGACLMVLEDELPLPSSDQCFVCNADNKLMMEIILPFKAKKDKSREDLDLVFDDIDDCLLDLEYPFSDKERARTYLKETGAPQLSEGKLAKDNDWKDFIEDAIAFLNTFEVARNPKVARATGGRHQCKFCVDRYGFDTFVKEGRRSGYTKDWSHFAGFCLNTYQKHREKILPYKSKSKITRSSAKVNEPLTKLPENSAVPNSDDGRRNENKNGNSDVVIVEHMDVDANEDSKVTVPEVGSPVKALRLLCPSGPAVVHMQPSESQQQEEVKSDPKGQENVDEKSCSSSVSSNSMDTVVETINPISDVIPDDENQVDNITSSPPQDSDESSNAMELTPSPSDKNQPKKVTSNSPQVKDSNDSSEPSTTMEVTSSVSPSDNNQTEEDVQFIDLPNSPQGKEPSDSVESSNAMQVISSAVSTNDHNQATSSSSSQVHASNGSVDSSNATQAIPSTVSPKDNNQAEKVATVSSSQPIHSRSDSGKSGSTLQATPSVIDHNRAKKAATVSRSSPGVPKLLTRKFTSPEEEVDVRVIPMPESYQPQKNQRRFIAGFQTAGELYAKQVLKLKNLKRPQWIFTGFESIAHIEVVPYTFNQKQRTVQRQYERAMKKHTEKLVFGGASSLNQQSSAENQINNYKRIVQSVAWDQQALKEKYAKCHQTLKKHKKALEDLKSEGGDVVYLKKRKLELLREASLCEKEWSELKTKLTELQAKRDTALKNLFQAESSYKKTSVPGSSSNKKLENKGNNVVIPSRSTAVLPEVYDYYSDQDEMMEVELDAEEVEHYNDIREEIDQPPFVAKLKIAKWTNEMEVPRYVGPIVTVDQVQAANAVSGPYSEYDKENNQITKHKQIESPPLTRKQQQVLELMEEMIELEREIYYHQNPQPFVYTDDYSSSDSDGDTSLQNRLELVKGGGDYSDAGAHCSGTFIRGEPYKKQRSDNKIKPKRRVGRPPKSAKRRSSAGKEGAATEKQGSKENEVGVVKSPRPTRKRKSSTILGEDYLLAELPADLSAPPPKTSKTLTELRLLPNQCTRVEENQPHDTGCGIVFSDTGSVSSVDFEGWASKPGTNVTPLPRTIESLKSGSIRSNEGGKVKVINSETGHLGGKYQRKGLFRSYKPSKKICMPVGSPNKMLLTEELCRTALCLPIYKFSNDNSTLVLDGDVELPEHLRISLEDNILYYLRRLEECEERRIKMRSPGWISPSGRRKRSPPTKLADNESSGTKRRKRIPDDDSAVCSYEASQSLRNNVLPLEISADV